MVLGHAKKGWRVVGSYGSFEHFMSLEANENNARDSDEKSLA